MSCPNMKPGNLGPKRPMTLDEQIEQLAKTQEAIRESQKRMEAIFDTLEEGNIASKSAKPL